MLNEWARRHGISHAALADLKAILKIAKIVWNSDGSPVESELLPECMAMEADRDAWKAKAEDALAVLKEANDKRGIDIEHWRQEVGKRQSQIDRMI